MATFKNTVTLFVWPSNFCVNIVSIFSWELQWSQEKIKTMLIQNFGVQNKNIIVFLQVANGICESREYYIYIDSV